MKCSLPIAMFKYFVIYWVNGNSLFTTFSKYDQSNHLGGIFSKVCNRKCTGAFR